jgi:protein phosphatase methylesterase 1
VQALQVALPIWKLDRGVYYTPPGESSVLGDLRSGQSGSQEQSGQRETGTVMVLQYGAGYSGLSFACIAKEITEMTRGECGVLAVDARRHG